jgi:hypothetical protein
MLKVLQSVCFAGLQLAHRLARVVNDPNIVIVATHRFRYSAVEAAKVMILTL